MTSKHIFVLFMIFATVATITAVVLTTKPNTGERDLQPQAANFKATYKASFQHLMDPECQGAPPTIQVLCRGDLTPVSLSSGQIACTRATSSISEDSAWNGLQCTTTCETQRACENLYLERDETDQNSAFGSVVFECSGTTEEDVEAVLIYQAGTDGTCLANTDDNTGGGGSRGRRNYHVAQLGVECPDGDASRSFLYDDFYFECSAGPSTSSGKFDDQYTCLSGRECSEEEDCSTIAFDPLEVHANFRNFYECIESLNPEEVPLGDAPPMKSVQIPWAPGTYAATFEAKWQIDINIEFCGSRPFPTNRISCLNETKIQNIEPFFDDINCTQVDESVVECQETTGENFVNRWSGVTYECTGPTLPETQVDVVSATAFCQTDFSTERRVGNLLQLGVLCGSEIRSNDVFFECGADSDYNIDEGNYTCTSYVDFPKGSPLVRKTPSNTSMRTDYRWSGQRPSDCYQFEATANCTGGIGIGIDDCNDGDFPESITATAVPSELTTEDLTPPPGTTYKVSYTARFQQNQSPGCEGAKPGMVIVCGSRDIRNVITSSPTIECSGDDPTQILELNDGRYGLLCESTESVYVSRNGFGGQSPLGEISFECHGESVNDVDGEFVIIKGPPGLCLGSGENFNMAQLAVLCPSSEDGLDESFVVDDRHSDCGVENFFWNVDGNYSCLSGGTCGANGCQIAFEQLIVNADPHNFPECIKSSNASPIPTIDEPATPQFPAGQYVVRFQTVWSYVLPGDCESNIASKKITCLNGSIGIIESTGEKSACDVIDDSIVECRDEGLQGSLIYECTSNDELPQTHIEYDESEVSCNSFNNNVVEKSLSLGILCGEDYFFEDLFLECGVGNELRRDGANRFTCFSPQTTIPATADNTLYLVNSTEIMTDYRWPLWAPQICPHQGTRRLRGRH